MTIYSDVRRLWFVDHMVHWRYMHLYRERDRREQVGAIFKHILRHQILYLHEICFCLPVFCSN